MVRNINWIKLVSTAVSLAFEFITITTPSNKLNPISLAYNAGYLTLSESGMVGSKAF